MHMQHQPQSNDAVEKIRELNLIRRHCRCLKFVNVPRGMGSSAYAARSAYTSLKSRVEQKHFYKFFMLTHNIYSFDLFVSIPFFLLQDSSDRLPSISWMQSVAKITRDKLFKGEAAHTGDRLLRISAQLLFQICMPDETLCPKTEAGNR